MEKADLGTKRACLACGMRFYDFDRSPIKCPGCGAVFDPEIIKRRKDRPVPKTTSSDIVGETDDDQIENVDDAEELPVATANNNDDDDIDFDDDDVDVDDDGPGIIQDAISEDDELLPNLDDKDEN